MAQNLVSPPEILWANLIHLSYNFWLDREEPSRFSRLAAKPYLRFDQKLWDDLLSQMSAAGMNAVVLDLGDAIQYQSHPEIAVEGAWSPDKLKSELDKMRALGLEPIPKLNFSTAHDVWLGEYSRMVSTPKYYEVCADLIREVCELFDSPRYFHLGMDEETGAHQQHFAFAVMRQHELWWHDLFFFVNEVEKQNVRAWVWSDFLWLHEAEFLRQMPKSVLQSNWYYACEFSPKPIGENANSEAEQLRARRVRAYEILEEHGFDQIPTGSNYFTTALSQVLPDLPASDWRVRVPVERSDGKIWRSDFNMGRTVEWCRDKIAPPHLKGFLTAPWHPTWEEFRGVHQSAIEEVKRARAL